MSTTLKMAVRVKFLCNTFRYKTDFQYFVFLLTAFGVKYNP